jgi:hypothetical protein
MSVNWYDVVKWCNARSEKDGLTPVYYTRSVQDTIYRTGQIDINIDAVKWSASGYRLPTECEWEFAAKGGTLAQSPPNIYSGSNTIGDVAWYSNNSGGTHSVGQKTANELGIYDMSGNVQEWCWDWSDNAAGAYPFGGTTDPKGPATTQSARLLRGGSFLFVESYCRVDNRDSGDPTDRYMTYGFRCVQDSLAATTVEAKSGMPMGFELGQNFPNPFNPETVVRYQVPGVSGQSSGVSRVDLRVYDLLGREVAVLVNEEKMPGTYTATWNAEGVASGIYFYQLRAGGNVFTKKMILLK